MNNSTKDSDAPAQRRPRARAARDGVVLSNTAPSTCNPPPYKVLRFGIDSLYLSFPGTLSDSSVITLETLKRLAQSSETEDASKAVHSVMGHQFEVNAMGSKFFAYTLHDHAYHIRLSKPSSKSMPLAVVQIRNDWIVKQGIDMAVVTLKKIIESFGEIEGEVSVSRVDVFADYLSPHPLDSWTDKSWVTRARTINTYRVGSVFTGWTIGLGGEIGFRLYDKTEEIKKSSKDYLKALWHEKGWEPGQVVKRAEFEFKNTTLSRLGLNHYDKMISSLSTLWKYGTQDWLRLTIPNEADDTRSRWPLHPDWELLTNIKWEWSNGPVDIPVRENNGPSDEWFATNGLAPLTSYMALHGIDDPDEALEEMFRQIRAHHDAKEWYTGIYYEDYAIQKAAEKAKRFGTSFPGVIKKSREIVNKALSSAYRAKRDGTKEPK